MTLDEMKLERDGWLHYGPRTEPRGITSLFEFVRRQPNGNVLTTDGGRGHIEWGPSRHVSPSENRNNG